MTGPEKQHILPRFYLSAFTQNNLNQGFLNVIDFRRGKIFKVKPENIYQKGFYNDYSSAESKYNMERSLADLEGILAPFYLNVINTGIVNGPKELGKLLSLVGLIQARGEWIRFFVSNLLPNQMINDILNDMVTAEKWNYYVETEKSAGIDVADWPTFENLKERIHSGSFIPKAPEFEKIKLITDLQRKFNDSLAGHEWSMAQASDASGGFICSISPLVWSTPERGIAPWEYADLKSKELFITFPLSSKYALANHNEKKGATYSITDDAVAYFNTRTLQHSGGVIYSGANQFLIKSEDMLSTKRVTILKDKLFIEKII